jgi:hypothetical protein
VNPGLQAALHVHRGGRGVDPAGSYEDERGQGPKKRQREEKPERQGSERESPDRSLRGYEGLDLSFNHISE